jgi:hypothetical protein
MRRDQDVPLFNVTSISYLIELSLGTPGQSVKVAIDTGSDELWVNPNCRSANLTEGQVKECNEDGHYVPGDSSTSQKLTASSSIQYGKGYVELDYYQDSIALPESTINVTKAIFGVATASEDLNEGILGLGWGKNFNLQYDNFIDLLAEEKVTNSRAFSVALGSVDASNGGVLIFGGVDTKKFTGPLVSNKILGPQGGEQLYRYWIQMTGISLTRSGTSSKYANSDMPVVLDSGSSLSYLPSSLVRAMAQDFKGQLDRESGLYLVDCSHPDSEGSVDFSFGQATIKVPFNEFIWQFDGQTCILGAVPVPANSGMTALLGDTFMRSAFVVFDQTEETISMAQYENCGENEQLIPAGGVGNFTGECSADSGSSGAGNSGNGGGSGGTGKNAAGRVTFGTAGFAFAAVAGLALAL